MAHDKHKSQPPPSDDDYIIIIHHKNGNVVYTSPNIDTVAYGGVLDAVQQPLNSQPKQAAYGYMDAARQ